MSLENAIQENILAIRELIAALENKTVSTPETVEPVKKQGAQTASSPAGAKLPTTEVKEPVQESVSEETVKLTYDDIKTPFLKELIAKKGREAGASLLAEFDIPAGGKLSDIPEDKWPDVLAAIKKAAA